MYDDPSYAERALRAGARGYLVKQESTQNILFAVHELLKESLLELIQADAFAPIYVKAAGGRAELPEGFATTADGVADGAQA